MTNNNNQLGKEKAAKKRLEQLRKALRAENISYGELAELESLKEYIDIDDVELRQAAGIPEFEEEEYEGDEYAKGGEVYGDFTIKIEKEKSAYNPNYKALLVKVNKDGVPLKYVLQALVDYKDREYLQEAFNNKNVQVLGKMGGSSRYIPLGFVSKDLYNKYVQTIGAGVAQESGKMIMANGGEVANEIENLSVYPISKGRYTLSGSPIGMTGYEFANNLQHSDFSLLGIELDAEHSKFFAHGSKSAIDALHQFLRFKRVHFRKSPKRTMADGGMMADGMTNNLISVAHNTAIPLKKVAKWADNNRVDLSKVSDAIVKWRALYKVDRNSLDLSKHLNPNDIKYAIFGIPDNKYAKDVIAKYSQSPDFKGKYFELVKNAENKLDEYMQSSDKEKYYESFGMNYKMANGGHVQGYDDREDERLSMEHGKMADKDFVGSHSRKEHSRRDDAQFEERYADGGTIEGYKDLSSVNPSKIEIVETTAYGKPDKLILKHDGKKIAQFYYNTRGFNQDFVLKNAEGKGFQFGGDKPKSIQVSNFKKALKEGFTHVKFYDEYANGGMMAKGGKIGMYELMPYIEFREGYVTPDYQAKLSFDGTKEEAMAKANQMIGGKVKAVEVSIINPNATNVLKRSKKVAMVTGESKFVDADAISLEELKEFKNYVKEFYGKGEMYAEFFPPSGATIDEISKAISQYAYYASKKKDQWGGGDSFDREIVRDIMFYNRGQKDGLEFEKVVKEVVENFKKADGGMMAKGGKMRSQEEYNALVMEKDKLVKSLSPKEVVEMWNKNSPKGPFVSTKMTLAEAKTTNGKMYLRDLLVENELTEAEFDKYFEKGGMMAKGGDVNDFYDNLQVHVQGVGTIYHGQSMKAAIKKAESYLSKNPKAEVVLVDEKYGDEYDLEGNQVENEEEYKKGGKLGSKAKYIPKYQIEEVEVDINGKEKEIDGADLLDGLYVKKAAYQKKSTPKKAKGGEVKAKSNRGGNVKEIAALAKSIRKDGEKWTDAIKRAAAQLKK